MRWHSLRGKCRGFLFSRDGRAQFVRIMASALPALLLLISPGRGLELLRYELLAIPLGAVLLPERPGRSAAVIAALWLIWAGIFPFLPEWKLAPAGAALLALCAAAGSCRRGAGGGRENIVEYFGAVLEAVLAVGLSVLIFRPLPGEMFLMSGALWSLALFAAGRFGQ